MFGAALRVVETAPRTENGDLEDSALIEQALPSRYSLQQLHESLAEPAPRELEESLGRLVVLWHALRQLERLKQDGGDTLWVQRLSLWLSEIIKPPAELVTQDEVPDDDRTAARESSIQLFKRISVIALNAMQLLQLNPAYRDRDVNLKILLSLLAFTDPADLWNLKESQTIAAKLLQPHESVLSAREFIVEFLLATFIRPLFSMSKPTAVTSQGRKALDSIQADTSHQVFVGPSRKPWKFKEIHAVTIFSWAVSHANESMVSQSWYLFIPPTLTIIDDPSTEVRVRGLIILRALLTKTSPRMLEQTGLGEIFEDAVMPTLALLPNLTPAVESLILLKPAYSLLFDMAEVRFQKRADFPKKVKFLDRIMRQGILRGIVHCRDNALILTLLLEEAATLINIMGIYTSKHLKDLIPILSSVLVDPFAVSQSALLLAGIKATQMTILNCWPRMTEKVHRKELVKALGVCWVNVAEGGFTNQGSRDPQLALTNELRFGGLMLVESVREVIEIFSELEPLLLADPALRELFGSQDPAT